MISHVLQNTVIFFSLVGIWHIFVLILCNMQGKETFRIGIKPELAGILVLLAMVVAYTLLGEF
ncbi:MAG: hypothetical protein A2653_02335 [Candidatus Zambryskibacteria bacterium RIFCSPHIGHO2_01_FULL_43_25]|uniref:Uncharacterized protein n=1 Tax=Candidatus Zambryskibacteria bacterium RIFCSPLOWO2_01_FULL_45_21 TaxID=1802761 RepID=A0A1G2U324_9BACT|nr:MAG: hypothetical protein A2653_02335 [Candidatus Zambryskibacteria bacterium RIFCSPHIGHO2_01_FULL_43_25]OHB01038.1 MAG: hypothetical protein A3E94_02515 [Candidatus Zambryskibacteria bacterium RIFCSPHIGHO2_12_FULL_44_12b]OHB03917.1 MAG: hypothetical protein A3B14_01115 [Candidatus Zambryskibacteria bacterium RIFCSPLOWO2_01_FULL_45_21]